MSKRFCFICEVHLETDHNVIEHLNKQHKCLWIRQPRAVNGCDNGIVLSVKIDNVVKITEASRVIGHF